MHYGFLDVVMRWVVSVCLGDYFKLGGITEFMVHYSVALILAVSLFLPMYAVSVPMAGAWTPTVRLPNHSPIRILYRFRIRLLY
jgi:hypothetical protein